MKLHKKFFTLFLLNSVLILVLFIGTMQLFIYRNFADYVNRVELHKLDHLAAALEDEYLKNRWEAFRNSPGHWMNTVHLNLAKDHGIQRRKPLGNLPHRPPRLHPVDPLQIGRRLVLFDAQHRLIAGPRAHDGNYTFREIQLHGSTIGRMGLDITEEVYHPLAMEYIKSQIPAFTVIVSGILLLSAFLSFFISAHLLRPVRLLTKGTRNLTSSGFNMKIDIRSKDELGELADDFNRMAETLKKYEEIRRQWISDISHELRTPLTIMRGKIEALLDGIRELNRDALLSLHSDVIRFGKLVNDLHLLSLADSRNLHMKKEKLDPLECLEATLRDFRTILDQHRMLVQVYTDVSKPAVMEGDRDRLRQLFSNLLENVLRYTDSPGVLKISSIRKDSRLCICFDDSAPGVPDEALARIFDRLYRVDKSRSRKLGGSGLGLAICRQITESHRGTIRAAHSSLGGLCIRVEFPLI